MCKIEKLILSRLGPSLLAGLPLTGCQSLESLPYSPPQTPATWLTIQPYISFQIAGQTLIVVQPTTSALVYLLGLIAIGVGFSFWRIRRAERSRLWWGIALVLWGGGALLAGTSYEAFSYPIKCAGRETCIWTSGWEIAYLVLSVASMDAMLIAQAYSCAIGKWRKILTRYAFLHITGYMIAVGLGTLVPIPFLISFELLLIVTAPNIVLFILQNGWRYSKLKQKLDLALLGTWAGLILTIVAYFMYLVSGWTLRLWAQGIWFSDNDVLHIGLILWMIYIAVIVAPQMADEPTSRAMDLVHRKIEAKP